MPFTQLLLIVALIALVAGLFAKKGSLGDQLGKQTFILFLYTVMVYGFIAVFNFLKGL